MTHGREPVHHVWPVNHVLPRVDISDPHTFLAIKRGILQYAWLKPILALAAVIMKATGTYQEGYIGLSSGYFWSGMIYNLSVTISLYSLGLFWVCMHNDLKPFRPVPKFLCVKLIIFASYWQGFFLSILVWLGALPDQVEGYTPDNLAAAIQDFLICIEMPAFAIAHWHAFSWHDFADNRIASARMPVRYAARDAFGIRDLIQDSKETFVGDNYGYRVFDSGDKIMAHEASRSRLARIKEGMRYERGGKGKYWLPRPDEINQTTPLLGANGGPSRRNGSLSPHTDSHEEPILDPDEEVLYESAKKLEYGDWNVSRCPLSLLHGCQLTLHLLVPRHHGKRTSKCPAYVAAPQSLPEHAHRQLLQPRLDQLSSDSQSRRPFRTTTEGGARRAPSRRGRQEGQEESSCQKPKPRSGTRYGKRHC